LYAVCRNLWLKEIRKRYGKEVTLHEDFEYKDEFDFEEAIFREERSKLVRGHFQNLSERCQKMLTLFYEETKKMVEIAQIMGFANANVAKKEKSKCQKRLVEAVRADTRFGDLRH
ncbi:MAG: sigma-70 family RNA polymerase sigma factor, partial [Bacteroidota bacterium]